MLTTKFSPKTYCHTGISKCFKTFCGAALLLSHLLIGQTYAEEAEVKLNQVNQQKLENAQLHTADWMSHGRDYAEQRFSPLDQINQDNISDLGLQWKFATGNKRGMESTPIVVDGIMYVTTAWSRVFALDASTGKELWAYDPSVPGEKARDACCDVVNRGLAIWEGKLFLGALDGRLIALDKQTGQEIWSVQTTDTNKPYTITGAPRVIKNKVIIGNGGAEFGVRGYFSAFDADSGKMLWRFYTVPTEKVDPNDKAMVDARRTWSDKSLWETGLGGTAWDSMAYDTKLNLLYVGTGNASQYNRAKRSPGGGDNLYISSILAINPDNGELVWHYQTTPADSWDYTATQHLILAELNILGQQRDVIMQAPKNGFFYVLDRHNGELISAEKYVDVNWASHVDPESGRPVETGIGDWSSAKKMISPAIVGGHNWHPMAFSPKTQLTYIPTIHSVYPFEALKDYQYDPNNMNTGEDFAALSASLPAVQPGFCSPTRLTAWDPIQQQQRWQVKFNSGVNAGILATEGGLVFQGTTDGRMVAYQDSTGETLWSQEINVGIMAPPISYSIKGEQYIAVVAGIGGSQGGHMQVLDNINSGHILAFKLGGKAVAPEVADRITTVNLDTKTLAEHPLSEARILEGEQLYSNYCLRCHGLQAKSSGVYPDLRYSSTEIHGAWQQVVFDGVLAGSGMASFKDTLTPEEIDSIHSYVINQAINTNTTSHKILKSIADNICIPAEWIAD